MVRQGWEPATPVQLLYKAWAQTDLGDIDLEDWVMYNVERVQLARDKSTVSKQDVSKRRKSVWDEKSKDRDFAVGDEVLVRKPGINMKLMERWEGPFKVVKKNSPLSYGIDMGYRTLPSVHVQLMKRYLRNPDNPKVGRVTSVFEPDTLEDNILDRFSEVSVSGEELEYKQAQDVKSLESKFKETITKEPGLTTLVCFGIETGD